MTKKAKPRPRPLLARIIVDLPRDYDVWRVIAVHKDNDPQHLPIECQIVGPIAFMVGAPRSKKRRVNLRRAYT